MISRRQFLNQSLGIAAASSSFAVDPVAKGITDVNVHLHRWPHHRLPHDESPQGLVDHLRQQGVTRALVGSFAALLEADLSAVNQRLAEECKAVGTDLLIPVGTVNPRQPNWEAELRRCVEVHGMSVLRLYPAYHGYTLAEPVVKRLLDVAAHAKVAIQIVAQMEDPRTQHPALKVDAVKLTPLPELLKGQPKVRVMVLNASATVILTSLQPLPNLWVDLAKLEGCGVVENLLRDWPAERVALGSNAPFFYWQAARLKLQESALTAAQERAITQTDFA